MNNNNNKGIKVLIICDRESVFDAEMLEDIIVNSSGWAKGEPEVYISVILKG